MDKDEKDEKVESGKGGSGRELVVHDEERRFNGAEGQGGGHGGRGAKRGTLQICIVSIHGFHASI